jgi:hypothetical protein
LGHVKEPSSCGSLRAAGKIRMFSFLPSLIEVSRAVWCGVPLEMKEGTIPIWGTKGLSTRPRCITLITHSFGTLHTTSEHGVSNITTADAHTSVASSRLN